MSIEERAKRVAEILGAIDMIEQALEDDKYYGLEHHIKTIREKLSVLSEFSQPDVRETAKSVVELAEKLYYSHPGIKKECYKPDFIKVFMEIVAPFLGEAPKEEKK